MLPSSLPFSSCPMHNSISQRPGFLPWRILEADLPIDTIPKEIGTRRTTDTTLASVRSHPLQNEGTSIRPLHRVRYKTALAASVTKGWITRWREHPKRCPEISPYRIPWVAARLSRESYGPYRVLETIPAHFSQASFQSSLVIRILPP